MDGQTYKTSNRTRQQPTWQMVNGGKLSCESEPNLRDGEQAWRDILLLLQWRTTTTAVKKTPFVLPSHEIVSK